MTRRMVEGSHERPAVATSRSTAPQPSRELLNARLRATGISNEHSLPSRPHERSFNGRCDRARFRRPRQGPPCGKRYEGHPLELPHRCRSMAHPSVPSVTRSSSNSPRKMVGAAGFAKTPSEGRRFTDDPQKPRGICKVDVTRCNAEGRRVMGSWATGGQRKRVPLGFGAVRPEPAPQKREARSVLLFSELRPASAHAAPTETRGRAQRFT